MLCYSFLNAVLSSLNLDLEQMTKNSSQRPSARRAKDGRQLWLDRIGLACPCVVNQHTHDQRHEQEPDLLERSRQADRARGGARHN